MPQSRGWNRPANSRGISGYWPTGTIGGRVATIRPPLRPFVVATTKGRHYARESSAATKTTTGPTWGKSWPVWRRGSSRAAHRSPPSSAQPLHSSMPANPADQPSAPLRPFVVATTKGRHHLDMDIGSAGSNLRAIWNRLLQSASRRWRDNHQQSDANEIGSQLLGGRRIDGGTRDLVEHAAPIVRLGLAKQTGGGVPRRSIGAEQPTPVRCERQENPDRLRESTGKVGDGSIDGNHKVELLNDCGGRGEVGEARRKINEPPSLLASRPGLQTE